MGSTGGRCAQWQWDSPSQQRLKGFCDVRDRHGTVSGRVQADDTVPDLLEVLGVRAER